MNNGYYNMGVGIAIPEGNHERLSEFLLVKSELKYLKFEALKLKDENGHWMPQMYKYWFEMPIGDMDNYDFNRDCWTLFNNGFTLVMTGID